MLSAILNGKGRRLPPGLPTDASLRMAFVRSEDIFTATVFERLAYLDGTTLWNLLCATFRPRILPERQVAELEHIEFWPTWGQAKETLDKAVEPDVVMRFKVGDPAREIILIVECKLGSVQHSDQWAEEWIAYHAEGASNGNASETYLLALGGLPASAETIVGRFTEASHRKYGVDVKATAADWRDLLKAVGDALPIRSSDRRVLTDIKAALALHGYSDFLPMAGLDRIAADYAIRQSANATLRWTKRMSLSAPFNTETQVAPVGALEDPLIRWVDHVSPFRSLRDHETLRWRD